MNEKLLQKCFGDVLRRLRIKKGLSQEKLAGECGLDRTFISLLERGLRQPTISTLFKISAVLEIKNSSLIKEVENKYENIKD
jgi:transcriptional regulator with XRE-family HTH domain